MMRAAETTRTERAAALVERLETIDELCTPILPSLLPDLRALIEADTALAYAFEIVDGELVAPDFVEVDGRSLESVKSAFRTQFPANRRSATFLYDPISSEPVQRNVALRLQDIPGWADRACTFAATAKAMGASDQLRILACDGPSLLAWVGGLRASPFTPRTSSSSESCHRRRGSPRPRETGA